MTEQPNSNRNPKRVPARTNVAQKRRIRKKAVDNERIAKIERRGRVVRKGRAKRERRNALIRFLLTLLVLTGLYYAVINEGWFLPYNAFNDGVSVQVVGNKIVQSSKIISLLRDSKVPSVPIYLMRTSGIKKQVAELSPVNAVYIRRYAFPARIQVIVREKIPAVTIYPDLKAEPSAFMTQDGTLIGSSYLPLNKEFKTIQVLSTGAKGDDYTKWNEAKVLEIQKIVNYIETFSGEPVEYLDLRNPEDIYIKIKTVNIRLGKQDENIYERMVRIPSLMPEVKKLGEKVKYLDLSWERVSYIKLKGKAK